MTYLGMRANTNAMSDPEPTYPSAEELMDQLGDERIDMMRSMMEYTMKPGQEEDGEATRPENE